MNELNDTSVGLREKMRILVRTANGMLSREVYDALFDTAKVFGGGQIVEVGTAHGAATIALGLGAAAAGTAADILTVDKMGGEFSTRRRYGTPEQNSEIALRNFQAAKLESRVELFVGGLEDLELARGVPESIDLLMLDADGRIDRDLLILYPKIAADAPIIIDDCDENVFFGETPEGTLYLDLKHSITAKLIRTFCDGQFLLLDRTVKDTAFCRKGPRKYDPEEMAERTLEAYRELVFHSVGGQEWDAIQDFRGRAGEYRLAMRLLRATPSWMLRTGSIAKKMHLIRA
ncbi:class I SAM-dependent methyltransferase [Candidatus Laterigemmans baculatus]|uniref:class I SAM-dependent methyltransferase n=1 Tax=Candidatus Laterigemmans baculatus TaxID=2770505 RepID=UPI0013DA1D2A|nr:class I SAM-dependent methyltransferase [Candidatus Laterigemmans baculatus]